MRWASCSEVPDADRRVTQELTSLTARTKGAVSVPSRAVKEGRREWVDEVVCGDAERGDFLEGPALEEGRGWRFDLGGRE